MRSDLNWTGDDLAEKVRDAAKDLLEIEALKILDRAQIEVPRSTGILEESGHVDVQENGVVIGFSASYASIQHEVAMRHPNPRDRRSMTGRKDHYLRDPFLELRDQAMENLARAIRDVIGG